MQRPKRSRPSKEPASNGAEDTDTPDRFAADYGLWAAHHARGELPATRAYAEACLRGVAARPDSPEAGRRASHSRNYALVCRGVPRRARASGTRARLVPAGP